MSAMIVKSVPVIEQRQRGADAGRRQRREDGQRVNEAFVENAEHDVHGDERRRDQPRLVGERCLEDLRGPLETAVNRRRHADVLRGALDRDHGVAE